MNYRCFIFMIFPLLLFLLSCQEQGKKEPKPVKVKDADINILSQFSLNYNRDLVCDSNSLIYYTSVYFDTSFVVHIVKEDTLLKGVCYFVPAQNKSGLFDDGSKRDFLFSGFNFTLNESKWEKIRVEYKKLELSISKQVCADCTFMFVSTEGIIKSGYVVNKNEFERFILKEVIHAHFPH